MKIRIGNIGKTFLILLIEFFIGYMFTLAGLTEIHIFTIYVFGILITVMVTESSFFGVISVFGILIFNYFFADPIWSFQAEKFGFPLTFIILLAAVFMIGSLTKKNRVQVQKIQKTTKRTNILLETSQMLQCAKCCEDIVHITGNRLMRILNKDIIVFQAKDDKVEAIKTFLPEHICSSDFTLSSDEYDAVLWVFENRCIAGATTEFFSDCKGTYIPIQTEERVYGAIGIDLEGDTSDLLVSKLVIGECALAYEREYYNKVREKAAVQAKNEKLRSDLLRSISHDLRNPLTGISGNAALLIRKDEMLTHEKRVQIGESIWKDANLLVGMVENLLLITKKDDIEKNIKMQPELLEELITEVVDCTGKQYQKHQFCVKSEEGMFVVTCNAQLIMQVIRNLLDNASKYTKEGTIITVLTKDLGEYVEICVRDEGEGICEQDKPFIFDMFFSSEKRTSDKNHSFGLGLTICKTIVEIHGGKIWAEDVAPHGTALLFTLKKVRKIINEGTITDYRR